MVIKDLPSAHSPLVDLGHMNPPTQGSPECIQAQENKTNKNNYLINSPQYLFHLLDVKIHQSQK